MEEAEGERKLKKTEEFIAQTIIPFSKSFKTLRFTPWLSSNQSLDYK